LAFRGQRPTLLSSSTLVGLANALDPMFLVSSLIVPIAVLVVFALLRKYLPAQHPKVGSQSRPSPEELDAFESWNWMVYLAMILIGVIFAWTTHAILRGLNRYYAAAEGPARFQLFPQEAIWWFFPGFGALCLSWEITLLIWGQFSGRERIRDYITWTNQRAGFDSTTVLRWFALLIALPIGILTLLAVPMHTALYDDGMQIGEYARHSPYKYRYSDARSIAIVEGVRDRDGKFAARAAVVIDFADGRRWSSADNRDWVHEVDPAMTEFLRQKIGLPMKYAETESKIPLIPR
jgi:hypothetical protein